MSLFGDIFSIFGGSSQKKAIDKATQAQIAAQQQGIDKIGAQQALTQASLNPYIDGGALAFGGEQDLLGLHGNETQAGAISALQSSPLFQSLYRQGNENILQNGAATGGLRGGNIQSSLANFGSDLLSRVIQQQLGNLGGLTGQGLGAATTAGNFGAQSSQDIASLFNAQGKTQAGGILDKAAVGQQQLQSLGGLFGTGLNFFAPGLGSSLGLAGGGSGSPSLNLDNLISSLPGGSGKPF